MSKATAKSVAREFQQIKDEGYDPDINEFLHHVPEDMREECRFHIEAQEAKNLAAERASKKEVAAKEAAQDVEKPKRVKLTREEARAMFAAMEPVASA
jgi:hypothetical protein